jgi:hypothetical protein
MEEQKPARWRRFCSSFFRFVWGVDQSKRFLTSKNADKNGEKNDRSSNTGYLLTITNEPNGKGKKRKKGEEDTQASQRHTQTKEEKQR